LLSLSLSLPLEITQEATTGTGTHGVGAKCWMKVNEYVCFRQSDTKIITTTTPATKIVVVDTGNFSFFCLLHPLTFSEFSFALFFDGAPRTASGRW
jgi:hypothetical protein